ncbi:hypothetical protein [Naumannella halotolerans]|uniref:Uncharacterized protein n=1 Tax=Naumannella halotolerans TaxID=993414 RepID=A0A4R7JC02_9ACTN|nr:hypothetical protein [Naumannella halotolerans]TDT34153.1 hypothetical protein CLV29_1807 [Naumannella halotolerans]
MPTRSLRAVILCLAWWSPAAGPLLASRIVPREENQGVNLFGLTQAQFSAIMIGFLCGCAVMILLPLVCRQGARWLLIAFPTGLLVIAALIGASAVGLLPDQRADETVRSVGQVIILLAVLVVPPVVAALLTQRPQPSPPPRPHRTGSKRTGSRRTGSKQTGTKRAGSGRTGSRRPAQHRRTRA